MKRKNNPRNRKILFDTIYREAGITTKKQKQRAPETIKKYLQHFVSCGYISAFKEEKDGITIEL